MINTFDTYQNRVADFRPVEGPHPIAVLALGVAGEAGEVADLVKKWLGHGHPLNLDKMKKELGDVLFYIAELSSVLGLDLAAVATANIEKLTARYPNGFNHADSINRKADT